MFSALCAYCYIPNIPNHSILNWNIYIYIPKNWVNINAFHKTGYSFEWCTTFAPSLAFIYILCSWMASMSLLFVAVAISHSRRVFTIHAYMLQVFVNGRSNFWITGARNNIEHPWRILTMFRIFLCKAHNVHCTRKN